MFVEFYTSTNIRVQVLEISVLLGKKAHIQAYLFLPNDLTLAKLDMTPEEYKLWSDDDDYIKHFICSKFPILGTPVDGEGGQPIQSASYIPSQQTQDDNRSVHNEADIQRITALESQIAEQTKLVTQLKNILISKGMI